MDLPPFFEAVDDLVKQYFSGPESQVVEKNTYLGMGASVTIEHKGVRIRFMFEKVVYLIDLAAKVQPKKWCPFWQVLLLINNETYVPGSAHGGTSLDDLRNSCAELVANFDAVSGLFSPQMLPTTLQRLAAIQQESIAQLRKPTSPEGASKFFRRK
jgi:hypothetical protein